MIVTIDGPAGSGKSTAARALACRLGFAFLDTGAMYRAVALAMLRRGIDCSDAAGVEAVLKDVRVEVPADRVLLDGEDITELIRTPAVSEAASQVAALPAVRWYLAEQQRLAAQGRNIVCEGRDQGTFVFPHAECKFFLTADARVRAERRWRELRAKGQNVDLAEILQAQQGRDARDASRELAPLRPAPDAIVIDTTHLTPDQVLVKLEEAARACLGQR